jgi:hypothetical protein
MPSFPAFVIKIKFSAKLTFDPYKICEALTLILIYFDSRLYWYSYSWVSWPLSQCKTERPRKPRILILITKAGKLGISLLILFVIYVLPF